MSRTRKPKYKKRSAKEGVYTYKANHDIFLLSGDDAHPLMFIGGRTYNMTVKDMYSYTTESELGDNHFITREWLKDNFSEVENFTEVSV